MYLYPSGRNRSIQLLRLNSTNNILGMVNGMFGMEIMTINHNKVETNNIHKPNYDRIMDEASC